MARLWPPSPIEAARKDRERFFLDHAEFFVKHHEKPINVDLPVGQRHFEKELDIVAQHDIPQGARAGLVSPIT